jgi:alkaline phosphatase
MKNKILRSIISVVLSVILIITFTACANNEKGGESSDIKNIIIIIGEGMGPSHLAAGQAITDNGFAFMNWQSADIDTTSVDTSGKGPILTDSAAGATAISTGHLTVNSYLGKDHTGADLITIMDVAATQGKSTGIVTTDSILGATPSAFSAHSTDRSASDIIFATQVTSGVNLLCGAADSYCTERKDTVISNGYTYCDDASRIADTYGADKAYWQIGLGSNSADVKLHTATEHALKFLEKNENGFVLMIEQAHIDKYSHSNDFEGMTKALLSLNDTVNTVMTWLGDRTDTAVIVTADHETGGLSISTDTPLENTYTLNSSTVYYNWTTTGHTNTYIKLFIYGFSPAFKSTDYYGINGAVKNTTTNRILVALLEKQ